MPVKFKYIEKESKEINGLKICLHESELSYLMLRPNGKTNYSLKSTSMQKNIDKISEETWETERKEIVKGFFVQNETRNLFRIHTNEGSVQVHSGDSIWVWAAMITDAFPS